MTDATVTNLAAVRARKTRTAGSVRQAATDWVARLQDAMPNTELLPAIAAAAVMVVCLTQLF